MPSKREDVLAALVALLGTLSVPGGPKVLRNEPLGVSVPAQGLINLRDGQPGTPETTLSPMTWHFEHRAVLEVLVQADTGRESLADELAAAAGVLIAANRTLGGLCDWCEAQGAEAETLTIAGAAPIHGLSIPVILHYSTTNPLT